MPTLPLKPTVLLILTLLLSSCAPQIPPPQGASMESTPRIERTSASTPTLPTSAPTAVLSTADGQEPPRGQGQGQGSDASQPLNFDIPAHSLDVILGRPTSSSITLSLLAYSDLTVSIAYGTASGHYTATMDSIHLAADTPQSVQLSDLQPDTAYFYSVNGGVENTFHTARLAGSTFTFTIQADSHLDTNSSLPVYLQALENQRADRPDFVIDLGDTFMTDKVKPYTEAESQYRAQRYYLSLIGQSAPLFLTLGNHDGEGAPRGNTGQEMSAWSANMRTLHFPNPVPDAFYTGNDMPDPNVGALQDYYAWEWGDALFIVLDPYWFTPAQHNDSSLWTRTLGEAQYQWLRSSLEASHAKWKFVFIHQLISGTDKNGRGGVEVAPFYEWGGNNPDGSYGFDEYRPGWGVPIHPLLVENHVTAVFHGHDHVFVKQELEGIIYQECPQPSSDRPDNSNIAAEYGYVNGDVVAGSGHLRVTVTPELVAVDFVRASLNAQQNAQTVYSYAIPAP